MGLRQILLSRDRLRRSLGANFDIKKFHADVLACLGPLDELDDCLDIQDAMRLELATLDKGGTADGNYFKPGYQIVMMSVICSVIYKYEI